MTQTRLQSFFPGGAVGLEGEEPGMPRADPRAEAEPEPGEAPCQNTALGGRPGHMVGRCEGSLWGHPGRLERTGVSPAAAEPYTRGLSWLCLTGPSLAVSLCHLPVDPSTLEPPGIVPSW